MLRVFIAVLLVLFASPALPQEIISENPTAPARHGNLDQADNSQSGHALDHKNPIAADDPVDDAACAWTGDWSKLASYLFCQSGIQSLFHEVGRALALLALVLAFAVLLLWFYLRRAVKAAELAAKYIPTAERAYVFGGPTDLALLPGEASVRLAMQNCGKTPAMISEWSLEFMTREPRGKIPAYDITKRAASSEVLEPNRVFSPANVYSAAVPSSFFIVGYIKYADVFQRPHVTRFCVAIGPDGKAAAAGPTAWNAHD